jgi:hypothetical protein
MNRLVGIHLNYQLAGVSHSTDHSILAWESLCHMDIVPGHATQAGLHDWIQNFLVRSMNDRFEPKN